MSVPTTSEEGGAGSAGVLRLPEELTIYTAAGLRAEWLTWLVDQREDVLIDGNAVAQVDAAGVQLLASLLSSLEARALGWRAQGVGGALRDALHTLGLATRLANAPTA